MGGIGRRRYCQKRQGVQWRALPCRDVSWDEEVRLWALGFRLWDLAKKQRPRAQSPNPKAQLEREAFEKARRALMRRDPILATIIKKHRKRSLVDAPAV